MTDMTIEAQTRVREAQILGKPPRLQPVVPEQFTDEMRAVVAKMGKFPHPTSSGERELAVQAEDLPEMWLTMLHAPEIYGYHLELAQLFFRGSLPSRDRQLAILRVAWLCQAPFEWGQHVPLGKQFGISDVEIARVTEGSRAPGWSDLDRAILRTVEELHKDAMASDETWDILAAHYDARQLIELIMLVGQYQTVAFYQNALRVRLKQGNQGLFAR